MSLVYRPVEEVWAILDPLDQINVIVYPYQIWREEFVEKPTGRFTTIKGAAWLMKNMNATQDRYLEELATLFGCSVEELASYL